MERALDVDVHDGVPLGVVKLIDHHKRIDSRVRGKDIDAARALGSADGHGGAALHVPHIDLKGEHVTAFRAEILRSGLGAAKVDVGEVDSCSFAGKDVCDSAPDAHGAAGDDGYAFCERLHRARDSRYRRAFLKRDAARLPIRKQP